MLIKGNFCLSVLYARVIHQNVLLGGEICPLRQQTFMCAVGITGWKFLRRGPVSSVLPLSSQWASGLQGAPLVSRGSSGLKQISVPYPCIGVILFFISYVGPEFGGRCPQKHSQYGQPLWFWKWCLKSAKKWNVLTVYILLLYWLPWLVTLTPLISLLFQISSSWVGPGVSVVQRFFFCFFF